MRWESVEIGTKKEFVNSAFGYFLDTLQGPWVPIHLYCLLHVAVDTTEIKKN